MEDTHSIPIILAVVGHVDPLSLQDVLWQIQSIKGFKVVFSKTSSKKLWVQEGE